MNTHMSMEVDITMAKTMREKIMETTMETITTETTTVITMVWTTWETIMAILTVMLITEMEMAM